MEMVAQKFMAASGKYVRVMLKSGNSLEGFLHCMDSEWIVLVETDNSDIFVKIEEIEFLKVVCSPANKTVVATDHVPLKNQMTYVRSKPQQELPQAPQPQVLTQEDLNPPVVVEEEVLQSYPKFSPVPEKVTRSKGNDFSMSVSDVKETAEVRKPQLTRETDKK